MQQTNVSEGIYNVWVYLCCIGDLSQKFRIHTAVKLSCQGCPNAFSHRRVNAMFKEVSALPWVLWHNLYNNSVCQLKFLELRESESTAS